MGVFFKEGETKTRPGVYQRYSNVGFDDFATAQDGICAIPVKASWGPLGKVIKNTIASKLEKNYGYGTYGSAYTVPAAKAMFDGGASVVYTYRLGSGGEKASKELDTNVTVTAKYPGTMKLSIAVQAKLSDSTKKQFLVYAETKLVETFEFVADEVNESANLIAAVAESEYVDVTASTAVATISPVAAASGELTGGVNPTVTNENYSEAFAAFEPFYYNTIALDVDDDADMTLSLLLQSYLDNAYKMGKYGIAVVGEKTTVTFAKRCTHAKRFNDAKVVYLGGGYMAGSENKDGVMAICYLAGVIASTPSNQGITHTVITGATELLESLTYTQYEEAIKSGMLMVSMSPNGAIWYDAAINTLTAPDKELEDDGWKKIRRVKVRFEMFDRFDRTLDSKVGKVSNDTDGIADVIQSAQRILDAMANNEGKLFPGAVIAEDPSNPYEGDSAWFIVQADDIDSLEKIYLHYQFRYSQNS